MKFFNHPALTLTCYRFGTGFIPSTSLSRQLPYILRLIGIPIMKLMPFVTTPAESGRKIARCAGYGTLEVSEDDLFVRDNKGYGRKSSDL
jgi:hypothetical protein